MFYLALQATVNLEPVSPTILGGADFVGLPSLFLGAELANRSCSVPGLDFERFYGEFSCPKTVMEAMVSDVLQAGLASEKD